jgi:hypothetical protein
MSSQEFNELKQLILAVQSSFQAQLAEALGEKLDMRIRLIVREEITIAIDEAITNRIEPQIEALALMTGEQFKRVDTRFNRIEARLSRLERDNSW